LGLNSNPSNNPAVISACFMLPVWLILLSWRWSRYVPPKHRLTFTGLHGVISQKTELFIMLLFTDKIQCKYNNILNAHTYEIRPQQRMLT
jgi:hypothetical protein